jgi:methyl-accepting chemotaxis protein
MKTRMWWICAIALVLVGAVWPTAAQSQEDALAESNRELEAMVDEVNRFVGDVRFDEKDVVSLIELWDEYNEFGETLEDDDEEMVDFDEVLADPEYRRWAASHGLDAKDWLQKTVRITMTLYREQILQSAEQMPQQMQQQMEAMEQQREQLGEEVYQQVKQAMEASAALGKQMAETASDLPEPTAAEKAALESHRDQLMMLMTSDDEEDEYGYEEDWGEDEEWE